MTSAGNAGALERAKGMMTNVVIGFIIVLSAWLIIDTVIKTLVDETKFGVSHEIDPEMCQTRRTDIDAPEREGTRAYKTGNPGDAGAID